MAREHSPFGEDAFGRGAEAAARFFGTPQYIVGQTIIVIVWIALNALAVSLRWDPYPLILLAQTRQADRDKAAAEADEAHRNAVTDRMEEQSDALREETNVLTALLAANTDLTRKDIEVTEQIARLTREIHARLA